MNEKVCGTKSKRIMLMTSNILSDLSSEIVQEGAIKFSLMSTMGAFSKIKKKTNFCLNLESNFLKVFLLKGTSFIPIRAGLCRELPVPDLYSPV
jgi:hypothetical protein